MKNVNYTTEQILNTLAKTSAYKCKSLEGVEVTTGERDFAIKTTQSVMLEDGTFVPSGSVVLFNSLVQVRKFFKKDNVERAHSCLNNHRDDRAMNVDFTENRAFAPICGGFFVGGVNVDCNKGSDIAPVEEVSEVVSEKVEDEEMPTENKELIIRNYYNDLHNKINEMTETVNNWTKLGWWTEFSKNPYMRDGMKSFVSEVYCFGEWIVNVDEKEAINVLAILKNFYETVLASTPIDLEYFWKAIDRISDKVTVSAPVEATEDVEGDIDAFIDDFEEAYTDETAITDKAQLDGAIQALCEVNEISIEQKEAMMNGGLKEKLLELLFPSFEFTEEDRGYIHALSMIERDEKEGLAPCSKDINVINDALTRFSELPSDFTEVSCYKDGLYYDFFENVTYRSIDSIKERYAYAMDLEANPLGYVFSCLPLEVLEHLKGFEVVASIGYDVRLFLDDGYLMNGSNTPLIDFFEEIPPLETVWQDKQFSILELFGGMGSDRIALENLGVQIDCDTVEVEGHAIEAYNSIHGTKEAPRDIKEYHPNKAHDIIIIMGSPCQDVSCIGKKEGLKDGLRSSLIWQAPRILYEMKSQGLELPKAIIWENVTGIMNASNIEETKLVCRFFELMGYTLNYQTLNTMDFGIPQNRRRIYTVFLRNDHYFLFSLMRNYPCLSLEHYRDKEYKERYTIHAPSMLKAIENRASYRRLDILNERSYCNTITTRQDRSPNSGVWKEGNHYRYISERESFLLQGLSPKQFERIHNGNTSGMNRALYKIAGNAFSVNVIQEILRTLFIYYF